MQQVQDLFQSFFYSKPAAITTAETTAAPLHHLLQTPNPRKAIPPNLSHLPSPLEEATFLSMMSDPLMRSAQKPKHHHTLCSPPYLRLQIMTANPSDETMDDFLTPQENPQRRSFSPGEENKQPSTSSSSREEQLAQWKASRYGNVQPSLSSSISVHRRLSQPPQQRKSKQHSCDPPRGPLQHYTTTNSSNNNNNNNNKIATTSAQSHPSQPDTNQPRYSIATFASSVSGLPPLQPSRGRIQEQNLPTPWQPLIVPRPNDPHQTPEKDQPNDPHQTPEKDQPNDPHQTPEKDHRPVSCSLWSTCQSPRSCSACVSSNEAHAFSAWTRHPHCARRNTWMPGKARRRASVGTTRTNPLERLSSRAAAQRMKERSLRKNASPSHMIVNVGMEDASSLDVFSPLTCSVSSGSACWEDAYSGGTDADALVSESLDIPNDSDREDIYRDNSQWTKELCPEKQPQMFFSDPSMMQQDGTSEPEDLCDSIHRTGPDVSHPEQSSSPCACSVECTDDEVDAAASGTCDEACVRPSEIQGTEGMKSDANEVLLWEECIHADHLSCPNASESIGMDHDDTKSKTTEICVVNQEPIVATSFEVNVVIAKEQKDIDEAATNSNGNFEVQDKFYDTADSGLSLAPVEGSFGSFEEGIVKVYRGMKEEDLSHETEAKIVCSIEEECPQLTSALLELEAFDWRKEIISPVITELPERRRTDATQLFLALTNHSNHENPSPQSETLPLETPESQISDVSFDWRKELQSPLIQPKLRRRAEASILTSIHSEEVRSSLDAIDDEDETYPDASETMQCLVEKEIDDHVEKSGLDVTPSKTHLPDNANLIRSLQKSPFHSRIPSPVPEELLCRREPKKSLFVDDTKDTAHNPDDAFTHSSSNETDEFKLIFEVAELLKVNGKAVLSTIPEDADDIQKSVIAEVNRLLSENRKFQDQIYEMRRSYDDRITPFRELFDERRKLAVEKAVLSQERIEHEKQVVEKQQKMSVTVQLSIDKVRFLQTKLNEARREKGLLTEKITKLEQENARLQLELEPANPRV